MTAHRPHPISGPWPFIPRWMDDQRPAEPVALVDRRPVEESLIYADPDHAILYDGCDRCDQHAIAPLVGLDNDTLGRLWTEMVAVERDPGHRDYYRTLNEARAGRTLYGIAVAIDRTHRGIDPWRWPWTYRVEAPHVSGSIPLDVPALIDANAGGLAFLRDHLN